jgi:hypothetical protein
MWFLRNHPGSQSGILSQHLAARPAGAENQTIVKSGSLESEQIPLANFVS